MRDLFNKMIRPAIDRIKQQRGLGPQAKAIVNMDVYKVHNSEEFLTWIKATHPDILLLYIPPGCTGKAQVCDLVINKAFKGIIRKEVMLYLADEVKKLIRNPGTYYSWLHFN